MTGDHLHRYFEPRTLARLQGLQLRACTIVEGYLAGLHRSPFHGYSIEFAEHREYAPGDDLRYLDWKLFGRSDKYYIKRFEDETNLICYIVLDVSESMLYRGPDSPLSKFEYAQCLAAALSWLVLQQRDAVSLITFDDQVRDIVPTSSSPAQWKHVLHVIESAQPTAGTRAGAVLHALAEKIRKRGVVIVISDLLDDVASLTAGWQHLRHQRHDVAVLQVLDPAELDFPFQQPARFRGLEGGPRLDIDPSLLRRAYQKELQSFLQSARVACQEQSIEYRLLRTDQPFDRALSAFVAARMTKVR